MRRPEKVRLKTAFGFWSILCKKSRQRPEIYPGKMFAPVRFRLPFPTNHEASPATRCNTPKKYSSGLPSAFGRYPAKSPTSLRRCVLKNVHIRQLSAFGQSSAENHSSGPMRRLEKVQLRTAFGFWSMPRKKPLQPSEIRPEKTLRPDGFRLLVDPLQKVSPASGDIPRKNVYACPLPAVSSHRPRGLSSGLLR